MTENEIAKEIVDAAYYEPEVQTREPTEGNPRLSDGSAKEGPRLSQTYRCSSR